MKNGSMSMSVKGVERERYGWVCVIKDKNYESERKMSA